MPYLKELAITIVQYVLHGQNKRLKPIDMET